MKPKGDIEVYAGNGIDFLQECLEDNHLNLSSCQKSINTSVYSATYEERQMIKE